MQVIFQAIFKTEADIALEVEDIPTLEMVRLPHVDGRRYAYIPKSVLNKSAFQLVLADYGVLLRLPGGSTLAVFHFQPPFEV